MIATTRWPAPGAILGVTNVTAFSFQSVITLAKADCAAPVRATANSPLQRLEYMLRSSGAGHPRVRIAAVTLSERVFGVNEPDGSPSGVTITSQSRRTYCAAGTFSIGLPPAERSIGATTEVPVSTFVAPAMSADACYWITRFPSV